ncbi:Ubiquitin carboxyl-terminal hydrolase family protein [Reticulomyxa filosa]|uniref:Ubiquitin carboxyl-terminal hydrolase family protein n=1 Tax=Reticulomyxa filosa TaxID=46433 RepID=X6MGW5_RETFI|nr:Ubiquitin carboxyl-terminal hydrolase family protein [Reticulomyxa filosa]|eukprot:ETO12295.1 Ubiquitin carboxyl-terminal hydrolase family protein [Reticulomyxa filosa]
MVGRDLLRAHAMPQHTIPICIRKQVPHFTWVGNISQLTTIDETKFGKVICNLLNKILEYTNKNQWENYKLVSDLVELLLHQLTLLFYAYGSRIGGCFPIEDWKPLIEKLLFCKSANIRKKSRPYLVEMYAKYNGIQYDTLKEFRLHASHICVSDLMKATWQESDTIFEEFFQFFGDIIKHHCAHYVVCEHITMKKASHFKVFQSIFEFAVKKLCEHESVEYARQQSPDCCLTGTLVVLKSLVAGLPQIKRWFPKKITELQNELLLKCLFDFPDPKKDTKENLTADHLPPIPKCKTSTSRKAAFDLLFELCKDNAAVWYEVLMCLEQLHEKYVKELGENKVGWNFDPNSNARSNTGYAGLVNYGCTCYCNASMQQLYANPILRKIMLGTDLRKRFPLIAKEQEEGKEKKMTEEEQKKRPDNTAVAQPVSEHADHQRDTDETEKKQSTEEKVEPIKTSKMKSSVMFALQEMFTALRYSNRRAYSPDTLFTSSDFPSVPLIFYPLLFLKKKKKKSKEKLNLNDVFKKKKKKKEWMHKNL